eukprot:scaffold118644_cov71-Phaeocystis_antarctica.AAC.3
MRQHRDRQSFGAKGLLQFHEGSGCRYAAAPEVRRPTPGGQLQEASSKSCSVRSRVGRRAGRQ